MLRWMAILAVGLSGCDDDAEKAADAGPVASSLAELFAGDGRDNAEFGSAVSLAGTTLAVGAQRDPQTARDAGAVYVYERESDGWREAAKVVAPEGAEGDYFGAAVDLDGDTLVVGAPGADLVDAETGEVAVRDAGAVFVFERQGDTWSAIVRLDPPVDAGASDRFGASVSLDGDVLAVGAPAADDLGRDAGKVRLYARSGATFTPLE